MPSQQQYGAPKKIVAVAGVVGTEPEYRMAGDTEVLEFRLAVTKSYEDGAEAQWFDVTVWNEGLQASVESELFRGAKVAVEGPYSNREYDGKTYHKISASRVGLIEWLQKSKSNASTSRPAARREEAVEEEERPARRAAPRQSRPAASRAPRREEPAEETEDALPW